VRHQSDPERKLFTRHHAVEAAGLCRVRFRRECCPRREKPIQPQLLAGGCSETG
jgi:hypothetical protein